MDSDVQLLQCQYKATKKVNWGKKTWLAVSFHLWNKKGAEAVNGVIQQAEDFCLENDLGWRTHKGAMKLWAVETERSSGKVIGALLFFHCQQLSMKTTGKVSRAGLHKVWQIAIGLAYFASSRAEIYVTDLIDVTLLMVPGDMRKISCNKMSFLFSHCALKINKR